MSGSPGKAYEMDVDDDSISLTSTLDENENSDEEWTTEGILAERHAQGINYYLIEWTGYPLEDATWEPRHNLNDVLLSEWEDHKEKIKRGEKEKFEVQRWAEPTIENLRRKHARHQRRNELRLSRGIEPTYWMDGLEVLIQGLQTFCAEDEPDSFGDQDGGLQELDDPPGLQATGPQSKADDPADSNGDAGGRKTSTSIGENLQPSELSIPGTGNTGNADIAHESTNLCLSSQKEKDTNLPSKVGQPSKKVTGVARMLAGPHRPSSTSKLPPEAGSKAKVVPTVSTGNKLSARKGQSNQAVTNVFCGGKMRKRRPRLVDVAADTTKDPKLWRSRYSRIIEKASRDRENTAPSQIPKKLISLDSRAPQPIVSEHVVTSPREITEPQGRLSEQHTDTAPGRPKLPRQSSLKETPAANLNRTDGMAESRPQPQQDQSRKSVHFDDNIQVTSFEQPRGESPESSLFVPEETPLPRPDVSGELMVTSGSIKTWRAPTPPLGQKRQEYRSITKLCLLGSEASRRTSLVFHGVPQVECPWLSDFRHQDCVVFSHTCMAQDFEGQFRRMNSVPIQNLAAGSVSSPTEHSILETIADRLKLASQGILSHATQYCILVFPSKCEEWEFEGSRIPGADGPLKYVVFSQTNFSKTDLAKSPATDSAGQESLDSMQQLPRVLHNFASLDYHKVFPTSLQKSGKYHIFLAFPSSALEEARLLALWVNVSSNAECHIYDGFVPGDWSRFLGAKKGAVILHEETVWKIRLFPTMFQVLNQAASGNYVVAVFQRALAPASVFQPLTGRSLAPGEIGLRRVLPPSKVFMMTPSFIISQPRQAWQFIDYFTRYYALHDAKYRGKLVVWPNMEEWLMQLLAERTLTPADQEPEIHRKDMEMLQRAMSLVGKLVRACTEDNVDPPLIFSPEDIDGNDEQSLVNWFGWWTIRNMDRFGRFYVIGSNNASSPSRVTRRIKPVRYKRNTINDPELASDSLKARAGADETRDNLVGNTSAANHAKFALVPDDGAHTLKSHLQHIHSRVMKTYSPLRLYFHPVGYWHPDMANRLGDTEGIYVSFGQWFKCLNPFTLPPNRAKTDMARNTASAFFYTPDGKWESAKQDSVSRRPWVVFFRPANPHHRPWKESELLIWDAGYQGKFDRNKDVYENDLIEAHRQLIKLVNERNREKNPTMPLSKVWVGGWDRLDSQFTHPLDITLDYLGKVEDSVKYWLPAPESVMTARGWKFVREPAQYVQPMDVDMDVDDHGEVRTDDAVKSDSGDESDLDAKMLFLPPRSGQVSNGRSLCKNLLYKESEKAIGKGDDDVMVFRYVTTTAWYGQQVSEGRDFKHIKVDQWKRVFEQLGLPVTE